MQCPKCNTEVGDAQKFCPSCGTGLSAADEPGPDVMIGQTLGGKYKVVRLLGEGGMGAVYEGEQQLGTTKRKVAVKTLHPHLSRDAKIKARFEREVGTIAELEHPNTIQVYDFGANEEGILYIVMEFLQGKSLADLLEKEGPMAPDRVARIMDQICGSLAEAHGRGIVHRDLKPDNVVLVDRAGKKDFVKVLDFGIAKRSKEEDKNEQKLTQQGMVLGTPPYMSPEQFTGKPIDARSDIYSLAVMGYEMLTGKLPFKADTAWEWATQHMTQNPIPIESLAEGMRAPEAMRNAIRRALAKSPDDRFQNVTDFSAAFEGGVGQPLRAGTAPVQAAPSGGGGRQKTEMGAPLDVAAAFGPGMGSPGGGPMAPAVPAYTPAAGNMSMPTPGGGGGIPQPPPRDGAGGGGNRGVILAVAGVIGVASIIAIVFAVKGSGSTPGTPLPTGTIPVSDPVTVLSGSVAPPDTGAPSDSSGGDVPPLNGSSSGGHGGGSGGGSGGHSSSGSSSGGKPAPYDGPDCQTARRLKAAGQTKAAQPYVLTCIAHGGTP
jgi:tRNA A-37 threonylcarbamoyl transferase component Bud32